MRGVAVSVEGEDGVEMLEDMVGETMVAFLAAAGVLHVGASLVMLVSTKRMPPRTRAGLLAACLLVPLIGPVLAVFTAWSAGQRSPDRGETVPGGQIVG